jgi:acetyl esterase/lipase
MYAAPARAEDLSGLPPTLVIVGGADGFRDECIDYARRLGEAGVETDLRVLAGLPHGVGIFVGTEAARRWQDAVDAWLAPRLTTPGADRA